MQTPERAALAGQLEESTASRGPGLQLQTAATHSVPQPPAAAATSPDDSIPQPTAEGSTTAGTQFLCITLSISRLTHPDSLVTH